ncbi:hypothetical protein IMX07_03125 [bacterium]|jgi:hypothetical protein|nr:hypothetical protein [bacterium]
MAGETKRSDETTRQAAHQARPNPGEAVLVSTGQFDLFADPKEIADAMRKKQKRSADK